ncbi:hypothetical protein LEP3755_56280 [Leptolyngbya sp. NIES-3755]|nr:hypothetical protein LEP3755_56280 [Leptolyngbya sp. NIES-3755]
MTLVPSLQPFERLQVSDGLLINADRWRHAHDYHRKRQNVLYQSLNQAGIVWGLGVCPIDAPAEVTSQYRDGRWIQIQPGLAIDALGNPIVVPEAIDFRISSEPFNDQPLLVYVVISYVDPDQLYRPSGLELVAESFRIDEKNHLPDALEIELCRIELQPGIERIETATSVLFPQSNSLDLRHRVSAQSKAKESVQVATLNQLKIHDRLKSLARSSQGLYPNLQINVCQLETNWNQQQLVVLSSSALSFTASQLEPIRQYVQQGGTILIESPIEDTRFREMLLVQQQLENAIAELDTKLYSPNSRMNTSDTESLSRSLSSELEAINSAVQALAQSTIQPYQEFAQSLDTTLIPWNQLQNGHLLLSKPFLFSALPTVKHQPIQLWAGDGLIVMFGELSTAWQNSDRTLSRETIRSAQEFGINLLHYAWVRHHLMQLQQS